MTTFAALASVKAATDPLQGDVVRHARNCVEKVFASPCASVDDEGAVMMALDAYEDIHPSAFAMQTARDLFTPRRHQTYSRERLRHWLLNDPDEDFAKTGMPGFLREAKKPAICCAKAHTTLIKAAYLKGFAESLPQFQSLS